MEQVDFVFGVQRGDEGKGRVVDCLAEDYDIVARFNGGANAGHTVMIDGIGELDLHQVPSGIAHRNAISVIGNGVKVDPLRLVKEIGDLKKQGVRVDPENLKVSKFAHMVMPHHVLLDCAREANNGEAQGTTKAGISFVASDQMQRTGIRTEKILSSPEKLFEMAVYPLIKASADVDDEHKLSPEEVEYMAARWVHAAGKIGKYLVDTRCYIQDALDQNKRVLGEGAQSFWLDPNQGMYPAVTSSDTSINGAISGLGINHKQIGKVTAVAKLTKSHVGGGPFVTEITDDKLIAQLRGNQGDADAEFGTTTGRPRRMGYFDLPELRTALKAIGADELIITKMDCADRFGDSMFVCSEYIDEHNNRHQYAPPSGEMLEKMRPDCYEVPTWVIENNPKTIREMPEDAAKFGRDVSRALGGIPIVAYGVGPERDQIAWI